MSMIVKKPWGQYEEFYRSDRCVFKILTIDPGQQTSLQKHKQRDETWYVISGEGLSWLSHERTWKPINNDSREYIPTNYAHRIKNCGIEPLVIAETQTGVCSEDDIVRYEDDYGRA